MKFRTGARPSPRHRLAAAQPHIATPAPSSKLTVPEKLSMWLNDVNGDCVTAEEAFAKSCNGILIADQTVQAWATKNDVLNGADLDQVLQLMQTGGFAQDSNEYDDGAYQSVDWTHAPTLQSAIALGPVKIGVASAQLQNVAGIGEKNGWFATGFATDPSEDHCVALCGFGTLSWLASQLKVTVPEGVNGAGLGYALFTWSTIGIIDTASLLAITGEAWVRNPTTRIVGTGTPSPDVVHVYPTPTPTPPTPTPNPSPAKIITLAEAQTAVGNGLQATHRTVLPLRDAIEAAQNALAALWK